jgi:uncharacterized protein YbjT (DUF2867 family)
VLVIGAYGLIGLSVTKALQARGAHVTGLGRNAATARRVLPHIPWVIRDVQTLTTPAQWEPLLKGVSHVINCSGILQDGPSDTLETIHVTCVEALAQACARLDKHLVQISAVGAELTADTAFLSTKARGDAAIERAGGRYHIFRPGLVLAPQAYGGSAMLRMLAAFPIIQPIALAEAKIQTLSASDLSGAVCAAVDGAIPAGFTGDLVEAETHTLKDVVGQMRAWLGFAPARAHIACPQWVMGFVAAAADGLSYLGWRSPLRRTAVTTLQNGVVGRYTDLTHFGMDPPKTLLQTLRATPSTSQDRLAARMALLMPVMIITLCLFWLYSGVIGLLELSTAAQVLMDVAWPAWLAQASVVFWAVVDIAIAFGFAMRKFAKIACIAAFMVSGVYLISSTLVVPSLWLDPLGPLPKVLPGVMLALVARAALEDR